MGSLTRTVVEGFLVCVVAAVLLATIAVLSPVSVQGGYGACADCTWRSSLHAYICLKGDPGQKECYDQGDQCIVRGGDCSSGGGEKECSWWDSFWGNCDPAAV